MTASSFNLNGILVEVVLDKDFIELVEFKTCNQLEYHNPKNYCEIYYILKTRNIKEIKVGNENVNKVLDLLINNPNLSVRAFNVASLKNEIVG